MHIYIYMCVNSLKKVQVAMRDVPHNISACISSPTGSCRETLSGTRTPKPPAPPPQWPRDNSHTPRSSFQPLLHRAAWHWASFHTYTWALSNPNSCPTQLEDRSNPHTVLCTASNRPPVAARLAISCPWAKSSPITPTSPELTNNPRHCQRCEND